MPLTTAVIIPALNEAAHIGPLVTETLSQPVSWVIVVNNGSVDNTAANALSAGAVVVEEPRQGYGYACAAGAALAQSKRADILIFMDGDYSSLPEEIPRLLAPINLSEADLVLGSRTRGQIAAGAMPPHQRFGNWLSASLMRRLYAVEVTDLGPYRAIRRELLESLAMQEMTFGWPTEMMVKAAKQNARIHEVPVSWHNRRSGRSKVSGTVRGSVLAGYHILRVTLQHAR
jgi:glycosyltransferase involved in cell wall biosynthesis